MASEEKKQVSQIIALKNFFGFKDGQTLSDFNQEVKKLSEAEKMELAQLVCKEMGWELVLKPPVSV